jgi:hypothetical protein
MAASGQNSGNDAVSARTASKPRLIRPEDVIACMDRMHSSRVRLG